MDNCAKSSVLKWSPNGVVSYSKSIRPTENSYFIPVGVENLSSPENTIFQKYFDFTNSKKYYGSYIL